jgi:hypothetical protein
VKPHACSRQIAPISGSGSTAPVLTDPAVPTTRHGTSPAPLSVGICRRSATVPSAARSVGIHGSTRCRAAEIDGLLHPRVRLGRAVDAQRAPARRDAVLSHAGRRRRARRHEADDVGHVAAADQQPPQSPG